MELYEFLMPLFPKISLVKPTPAYGMRLRYVSAQLTHYDDTLEPKSITINGFVALVALRLTLFTFQVKQRSHFFISQSEASKNVNTKSISAKMTRAEDMEGATRSHYDRVRIIQQFGIKIYIQIKVLWSTSKDLTLKSSIINKTKAREAPERQRRRKYLNSNLYFFGRFYGRRPGTG
jgi:hypothetical protein